MHLPITLLLLVSTWKLGDTLRSLCRRAGLEHTVWAQRIIFYVFKFILVFRNTAFMNYLWKTVTAQNKVMHPKLQAFFELIALFVPVQARREDSPRA